MVRSPSSLTKTTELKKGPWTSDEDEILTNHIKIHGHPNWRALPRLAGLARCGKSCRLRWTNYLQPGIKRGNFTREEEDIIITSHQLLGNRWSAIAAKLPGRTDNEIKNVWHTHLKKRFLNKDDIQQSSASSGQSSISRMSNEEKDFILVDESIFDTVWEDNQVQHTADVNDPDPDHSDKNPIDVTPACNTNNDYIPYVPSTLPPFQRSYSETSYNNYKDVPSPEEFPETDESFWSDVLSSDQDYNNSGTSSSMESYYPFYDQQPANESSFPPIQNNNVICMETDHSQEAHASSFLNVGYNGVSNVISEYIAVENGGDVDDFWFDVLFRAGEHPVFLG